MKKLKFGYLVIGFMLLGISCNAPEEWAPKYDDVVPGPVSNVRVENVNGGAIIYYTLPSDIDKNDLMGAKVVYTLTPDGEEMEQWASAANDSIELEGYGDTNERTVMVYAVHKNTKVSTGVTTTIKPLTPLISAMRETLKAMPTFSGIQVTWDNPRRKNMGIELYVEDEITHEMVLFDKYFSDAANGKVTFRPFTSEERKFRIEMFDRWKNYAPPFETTITPLFEEEILARDGSNPIWSLFDDGMVINTTTGLTEYRYRYRCDLHTALSSVTAQFIQVTDWDDTSLNAWWSVGSQHVLEDYIPGTGDILVPFPFCVTFDMGRKAVYSRMAIRSRYRAGYPVFSYPVPVEFEVWGSNNPKTVEEVEDPHGIHPKGSREANQAYWSSWIAANGTAAWKNDGWTKIGICRYVLSSGENDYYADMPLSAEDVDDYLNGYYFDFDLDVAEPFRYLRWEVHKTNTGVNQMHIHGIRYWGKYVD